MRGEQGASNRAGSFVMFDNRGNVMSEIEIGTKVRFMYHGVELTGEVIKPPRPFEDRIAVYASGQGSPGGAARIILEADAIVTPVEGL